MSSTAAGAPVGRPVSLATVLAVALLLGAVGTTAWVVWQLTAGGRAPVAFRERPALPQCTPIEVPHGQSVPMTLQECLLSSDAQRIGAEVLVTSLTTEGDPIEAYYRVLPGGTVEIFTDATADSFGSRDGATPAAPTLPRWGPGSGAGQRERRPRRATTATSQDSPAEVPVTSRGCG